MTTVSKTTTKKVTKTTTTETSCSSPQITITKKGDFFNDSYFENNRQDYQVAVRDVLSKFGGDQTTTNELQSYRDLRTKDLKEENQAVMSTQDDQFHKIVIDVQDFAIGGVVNVKTVDEQQVVIEGQVQKQEGNSTSSKSFMKTFIFSDADMESITSVMSSDGILTVTIAKEQPEIQQIMNVEKKISTVTQQTQNVSNTTNTTSVQGDKTLNITQKGNFFDDSFFEDARKPFQEAVQNVLQKSNETTSQADQITTYRNLRQRELKEETQAATTSDDQNQHKIIVDVQDFIQGGDVVVKTVDDREVIIEGSIKKQEGNKTSSKSFRKRYVLPEDIQTENVTSVVSADGVLTIIAPKKSRAIQPGEVNVPLAIQQTNANTQVVDTNKTNTAVQNVNQQIINTQNQVASQDTQQQNVTIQKKVTTVTQQSNITSDSTESGCTSPSDRPLSITKKGDFFNDSFFEDARKPFQEAVRNVLHKSNVTTSETNEIQSYRDLRQQNLQEETQAATTSDNQNQHKIIVDVQDFINGGEVIVKTVDDRQVIIEGSIKKQEGNKTSSKSFRKQYCLADDIQTDEVTSVVSSDGILTIIAPKKPHALQPGANAPLAISQADVNKQVVATNTTNTAVQNVNQQTTNTQSQVASQNTQEQNVTIQKKVTTVTQQSNVTTDSGCTSPTSDRPLPITKKGDFFNDSFFEDARKPFQEAVKNVLQKSNVTTTDTNEIQSYRDLRQQNLKEETQAATTSDDQNRHKIIVDVQDFINGGEVIVKTVDERQVIIEGSIKKQEGNKTSSKSFRKQYCLADDIQTDEVTSVVSSDGILTIIAPKKPQTIQPSGNAPLAIQQADVNNQVVATNTTNTAVKNVTQQTTNTQSQVASQDTQQQNVTIQKKVTTVTQQSNITSDSTDSGCISPSDKPLSITKKGDFFNDSFFEDARKPFQEAVRNVLQKSNVTTSETNEIQSYRDLRQQNLQEETQAATTSDNQNQHKIIVDVQDFINGGEVIVKTVDDRQVIIEGSIKKQEGNKTSSKSFRKQYCLADDIQTDEVTSVVSSDGILTIIAPKKPQAIQFGDVGAPLALQQTDSNKELVATNTTNTNIQNVNQQITNAQNTQSQVASQNAQQQNVTVQKKVTTVTQQSNVTTDSGCTSPSSDRSLPITKKGDFFNDSFFEDARKPFQEAIKNVLQKSNVNTTETNEIQSYRDLRQQNLKEENQAETTSDTQDQHKIIVDVQDFINGGDVIVKTVDERVVIIEGSIKKQEGNKTSSKSFRKQYTLPEDIQTENVTSVVSSDGVLTIIAPKKVRSLQPGEMNVPLAIQQQTDTNKQITATNTAVQNVNQQTTNTQQIACQDTQQQNVTIQKKVTTVTQQSNITSDNSNTGSTSVSDRSLSITKKGDFFNDSFFEDARKPFQEAIRDVLQKSSVTTNQTNEIQSYRDLRQRELKEETQAATISDDQNQHKIIVDVQDFINGGDVIVKTVNEREVVIEGSIKKQEGNKTSSKSFRKQYTLPEDIQSESVTSVVSADGVLTIIAPRKVTIPQNREAIVPMKIHQQAEANNQIVASNTTNKSIQSTQQKTIDVSQVATQQTQEIQQNISVQKKVTKVTSQQTQITGESTRNVTADRSLTITKKGDFFSDSFFEDARRPFQEAIRNVLSNSNVQSNQNNEITLYRNLRKSNLNEENQAATVSDDQRQHKIIVDVQDFINEGDVIVKTVDEREVVIEGSIKKEEGDKITSKRFRKRYILPEDIVPEAVTSVVSADGVMTVIAPKRII